MKHYILFTGHMIDAQSRKEPRFPAQKEEAAKQKIEECLLQQKNKIKQPLEGIASCACGGDILFQEACKKFDIPTQIYLPMRAEKFKKDSVSFAGKEWDERFESLIKKIPLHVLPTSHQNITDNNVYELNNEWMLNIALSSGGKNMTLIALWNLDAGDGKGGTQHLVNLAKSKGAEVDIIDINKV